MRLEVSFQKRLGSFRLSVDFEVPDGLTVLFGPSGCGKSSTLAAIAGLLRPDRGSIRLGSETLFDAARKVDRPVRFRRVGYVFQNYALFPHLDVRRNICFGIEHEPPAVQKQRLDELLGLLQLNGLAGRSPRELSGGQQQRVALARALAPGPRILLLDEPFSALETELRQDLGAELKRLQSQLQLPVLMVTHSRSETLQLADTVVQMAEGQVLATGSAADLLTQRPHTDVSVESRFSW